MFGEIVKAHRHRLGLSQEELAEKVGVNPRTIGNIEAGRIATPRASTVRLLAAAFNLRGVDRERFCSAAIQSLDTPEAPPAGAVVPRQLPAVTRFFAGRREELSLLDSVAGDGGPVVIATITGPAGIGKTTLALHWAREVADRFPDGQLYVNLRGFDALGTQVTASEALSGFLDALDVPARRVPPTPDGKAALFRSVLAGRRVLVVLDNARDSEHVRPLLPGSSTCAVVVTSRNRLAGLAAAEAAHTIILDLLPAEQAYELLAQRLGHGRLHAEPQAAGDIVEYCARLPLALAIVAARAAAHPRFPLADLAAELRDVRGRLDALRGGDIATDVRAVFSWSYDALDSPAARLFRLVGLHPGADFSVVAAASLAGHDLRQTRSLLDSLTQAHMLIEHTPGRYAAHDLLRAYAADLVTEVDPEQERDAAWRRLFDYHVHTAYAAERLLDRHRPPITIDAAQPGARAETPADPDAAMGWFLAERDTLLALFDAPGIGDPQVQQLAWCMANFLYRRGSWNDLARTQRACAEAGRRRGDARLVIGALNNMSRALVELERFDDALGVLDECLRLAADQDDIGALANAELLLYKLWERRGDTEQALHHLKRSAGFYDTIGHPRGRAVALDNIGLLHMRMGDYEQALAACREALALHEKLDIPDGQAAAWDNLGNVHLRMGEHHEAIACYERSLVLVRDLADVYHESIALTHLGDAHAAAGDAAAAGEAWRRALSILDGTSSPDADEVREKLHRLGR